MADGGSAAEDYRRGATASRLESLRGVGREAGKDRDEAPPSVLRRPGDPVSVRKISSSDNRGSGASLGRQLKGVPDGARVRIRTTPKGTE